MSVVRKVITELDKSKDKVALDDATQKTPDNLFDQWSVALYSAFSITNAKQEQDTLSSLRTPLLNTEETEKFKTPVQLEKINALTQTGHFTKAKPCQEGNKSVAEKRLTRPAL